MSTVAFLLLSTFVILHASENPAELKGARAAWKRQYESVERLVEYMQSNKMKIDHEVYKSSLSTPNKLVWLEEEAQVTPDAEEEKFFDAVDDWGFGSSVDEPPRKKDTTDGVMLKDQKNGLCMDVHDNAEEGAWVYLAECDGGQSQRFYWVGPTIRSKLNDKCITVDYGGSNRQQAVLRDCEKDASSVQATMNQFWYRYYGELVSSVNTDLCLDAMNGWISDRLMLYNCHGEKNQMWNALHRTDREIPPKYDADDIRNAAHLATCAYVNEGSEEEGGIQNGEKHEGGVKGGLTQSKLKLVKFISEPVTDVQAFVAVPQDGDINKEVVVGVRGTESKTDAIIDLKFWPTAPVGKNGKRIAKSHDAYVHLGFITQYNAMQLALYDALEEVTKQGYKKILVTGHSLGGAVASLTALDLYNNLPFGDGTLIQAGGTIRLITFGAPRVGNDPYVFESNSKIHLSWRVVNNLDPVPCVPPEWLGFGNIEHLIWFDAAKDTWKYDIDDVQTCGVSSIQVGNHMLGPGAGTYQTNLLKLK